MTHTVAEMSVSQSTYDEVDRNLREAGYEHAIGDDGVLDMTGIGLTPPASIPDDERFAIDPEVEQMRQIDDAVRTLNDLLQDAHRNNLIVNLTLDDRYLSALRVPKPPKFVQVSISRTLLKSGGVQHD